MSTRDEIASRLGQCAWVDDPILGPVVPDAFAEASEVWPLHDRWDRVDLVRSLGSAPRVVSELRFVPATGGDAIPVGIVWDASEGREVARVYYDKTRIGGPGSDTIRSPIVPPDPDVELHPTIVTLVAALCVNDVATTASLLAPGFRQSMPDEPGSESDESADDYAARSAGVTSGVTVTFASATRDGDCTALEFISWRTPPHCGLTVVELTDAGLISDLRNYEGPQPVDLRETTAIGDKGAVAP